MRIAIAILSVFVLFGCEKSPYELMIDKSCSGEQKMLFIEAIRTLNEVLSACDRDTISYIGDSELSDGALNNLWNREASNDGEDYVACIEPGMEIEEHTSAAAFGAPNGDIVFFNGRLSGYADSFYRVALHELGHYVDAWHVNSGGIMDLHGSGFEYNEGDIVEICR